MTSTVFLLGGAFSNLELNNYMPVQLQGQITAGNTSVIVPYNTNGLFLNTVQQGAQMLDSFLTKTTGTMVVFGHSLGAVVSSYWLATYGPVTTISPADLSFTLIGDSIHPYGGALGPEGKAEWQNWFTTAVDIPTDTPFTVHDVIRQYDGWADWPTGTFNFDAEFNALSGQNSVHPNYQNVSLTDPNNVSYSVGNITYTWSQTIPVPLYGTTWNSYVSPLDEAIRPTIEAAYSRPVTVPTPTY